MFFFLAVATGGVAPAQTVDAPPPMRGPLPVRDYEPINALFLLPTPADTTILAKKAQRLDVNIDLPNNFLILPQINYYADFENQRFTFAYSRGLGGGQEIGIRIPYVALNGGITDGLVNGWHKLFHIYGGGRGNFKNDQFVYRVYDATSGKFIERTSGASGLGDITLEYRRALTTGQPGVDSDGKADPRKIAISARALLKLPTGSSSSLIGSGAFDAGLGVMATAKPFHRVALHGNLSVVWNGKPDIDALKSRSTTVHSLAALEWIMDGRTSFVMQIDSNSAPNKTGVEYADRDRRMFDFGFWRQITPRSNAYLSLGENDFGWAANMAPDIILSAGTRIAL